MPGPASLRYGGNTTCVEIEDRRGTTFIIDAGTGIRPLGTELMRRGKGGPIHVLLTHFHWDHIQGWPFFTPAFIAKNEFVIHGKASSPDELRYIFGDQMRSMFFPVEFKNLPAKFEFIPLKENSLKIGNLKIETIENCHPGGAYGLRIHEDKKVLVFMTDHEAGLKEKLPHSFSEYAKFAKGAELLVHDAQFTDEELPNRKTWGHSSYQEAIKLALETHAKNLALTHHAPERFDYEIDRMVADARTILAKIRNAPNVFGLIEGAEYTI